MVSVRYVRSMDTPVRMAEAVSLITARNLSILILPVDANTAHCSPDHLLSFHYCVLPKHVKRIQSYKETVLARTNGVKRILTSLKIRMATKTWKKNVNHSMEKSQEVEATRTGMMVKTRTAKRKITTVTAKTEKIMMMIAKTKTGMEAARKIMRTACTEKLMELARIKAMETRIVNSRTPLENA